MEKIDLGKIILYSARTHGSVYGSAEESVISCIHFSVLKPLSDSVGSCWHSTLDFAKYSTSAGWEWTR